jgi:hypothetical protein
LTIKFIRDYTADKYRKGKFMNISDMLCDMYDIRRQARLTKFDTFPKDNDGTETTIKDCIDNIIEQLEKCQTSTG